MVSLITSRISPFSSRIWLSTALCDFASERILFRNASTGLAKATAQVMHHKTRVATALNPKYVKGVIAWGLSFSNG
jgi:hypothetical protein